MKSVRQVAILDIISKQEIDTQEALAEALCARGIRVTQATVSRDIKEMRLVKVLTSSGIYKYASQERSEISLNERLERMLTQSLLSVAAANNLIVAKTLAGSANVAAEAIDSMQWPEVLGTLAGDNTILIIIRSNEEVQSVMNRIDEILIK